MRNGKGVSIPKFGNFTFSAPVVDLAVRYCLELTIQGTTNPQSRDTQHRVPVFLVGKDFVSAVELRTGVAHTGGTVRPYDIKGSSGIIPKVKINYTEVAALCAQTKDICRNGCEQVFRFLSDKVRKGEMVQMEIPYVGTFQVRNNIAAVAYNSDIVEETKGQTAKGHLVNKLFANSVNRLNMQIHDQNQTKQNPSFGMGGAMKVTGDAESWLKSNLNISVQEMLSRPNESRENLRVQSAHPQKQLNRYGSMRPEDLKRKSWAIQNGGLTEKNKQMFDRLSDTKSGGVPSRRPMSAVTRLSQGSRMTNVPEVGRMKLMIIANDIFKNRAGIADYLSSQKQSLRNVMSSSEIASLLKKTGIYIDIGNLKALLRELGFNWNGPACSFYDLFQTVKIFIYGTSEEEERTGVYFQSMTSPKSYESAPQNNGNYNINKRPFSGQQTSRGPQQLVEMIKDLFYATRKSLYELFNEGKIGSSIDCEGLKKIIFSYGGAGMSEFDIQNVFSYIARKKDAISYQEFDKVFRWEVPAGGEWETKAIRAIREWMFKNNLSSETAFDQFLKTTGRHLQKTLTRVDFHKALNSFMMGQPEKFSAPEIDALFALLDINQDGELDVDEWKTRIYEDSLNPLQMLREIINNNRITADDLLFKMHLRIWDNPLDFPRLCEALRKLDPTLSEPQIRMLAKMLKNKENKVEVTTLLRNLCGQEFETVDFRNKIFRQLYAEIHPNKERELLQLLEDADPLNDGRVEPQGLKVALKKIIKSVDEESIDRFIRFLDKDRSGKVNYMEFMARMGEVSNREHNPFKSVVQRVAYFIESNKQTIHSLLKRLAMKRMGQENEGRDDAIPVSVFAQFLKSKIDKKRDINQLHQFANYIDVDKDGFISEIDLQTCLNHLNSDAFFKNSGEALAGSSFSASKKFFPNASKLTEERAIDIAKQIRTTLINQKIAYREAFNRFDQNKDGFLSFTEFSQGIDKVLTLSVPVKEKLFALMDKNSIGLVDYPNFLEVIQLSTAYKLKSDNLNDNFDWEDNVIAQISQWIWSSRITVEEAFKSFDRDFDGSINKEDLKWALQNILHIKPEEIQPTKLDRLFRLMDFYKTNQIQLSDFQRLVNNENPYSAAGSRSTPSTDNFRRSMGGGFSQTSTFDWKLSAIQQIGLVISKKYGSVKESFEDASEYLQKVNFEQFKKFLEKHQALSGFNLTLALTQKLFSEMDPHKKGYLTENDWVNALQAFNWNDQIFIELKNQIQCSFSDCDSAYQFFLTFKKQRNGATINNEKKTIGYQEFESAVNSLTCDRFKKSEVQSLWKYMTDNGKARVLDRYQFRSHFDNLHYTGNSTVRKVKTATPSSAGGASLANGLVGTAVGRTTIYTQNSSSSTWNEDVFEKLRQIVRTSSQSFEDIFKQFDSDKNGFISQVEFRNAIRKLNLGLSSREIDKLMAKIDTNNDGKIDWKEFISKFKVSDLDERMKERAKDKMGRIKELMILHMTSPNDAFRFFDESKLGKLSYQEFSKLVIKLNEMAGEKLPAYPVIKDLFDTIDIRKDGIIDVNEWQQTFGNVVDGSNKLSIKATPLTVWESTSREFQHIGSVIARNRKMLKEQFDKIANQKGGAKEITFEEAKKAMALMIEQNFKTGLADEKLKIVMQVAEIQGSTAAGQTLYDANKLLNVYKGRHAGPQL